MYIMHTVFLLNSTTIILPQVDEPADKFQKFSLDDGTANCEVTAWNTNNALPHKPDVGDRVTLLDVRTSTYIPGGLDTSGGSVIDVSRQFPNVNSL